MKNFWDFRRSVASKAAFRYGIWLLISLGGWIQACKPVAEEVAPAATPDGGRKADQELDIQKIRLTAKILQKLYRDPAVRAEVNAAVATGLYKDERIKLKDLLQPTTSIVYQHSKFDALKARPGSLIQVGRFAEKFMQEAALQRATPNGRTSGDYFTEGDVTIYFPYSENFEGNNEPIAVVAGDEETDGKWVTDPRCDDTQTAYQYCSQRVYVNDDYAEAHPTHIVTSGGERAAAVPDYYAGTGTLNKVFLGWIRCRKQYDKLIGTNKQNCGGVELRGMRISGYLKTDNQQITTYENNLISVRDIKRKEIKAGTWVRVYDFFDTDWAEDDKEQGLVIFEEDAQGESKIEGSLTTKVKLWKTLDTEIKPISYSITVKTQDEIPVKFTISRNFLFTDGKNDQHHGFHDGWPIYSGEGPVSYTIPFEGN